jgi:hypothetical protein
MVAGALDKGFAALQLEASTFKRAAFSESTKASYRSHRNAYLRFCLFFDLVPVPATQLTLRTYVAFLARSIKSSGINGYLNIVRIMHLEAGMENPLVANYELNMIKRGVARQLGTPAVQMLPLEVSMLRKMFSFYDMSESVNLCFGAALLVGFFGMLRKSSLLLKFANSPPESGLCRSDVENLTIDHFVLVVRKSKTNQFGRRVHRVPFVSCTETSLFPVNALLSHLVASKLPSSANLFSYVEVGRTIILNHADFVRKLRLGLSAIGLNPSLFSGHSMRRGGCTMGFEAGLSVVDLKLRGDWQSDAVERYLFVPSSHVVGAARSMAEFAAQCE